MYNDNLLHFLSTHVRCPGLWDSRLGANSCAFKPICCVLLRRNGQAIVEPSGGNSIAMLEMTLNGPCPRETAAPKVHILSLEAQAPTIAGAPFILLVSNLAMSFTSWSVMAGARDKLVVVVNPLVRQKDVIGLREPLMFIVVVSGECEFLVNIHQWREDTRISSEVNQLISSVNIPSPAN